MEKKESEKSPWKVGSFITISTPIIFAFCNNGRSFIVCSPLALASNDEDGTEVSESTSYRRKSYWRRLQKATKK